MDKYMYKSKVYSVVECTLEDIPSHIERVFSYWQSANVNITEQTSLLEKAVANHTAYKVINDNGDTEAAIYYEHTHLQSVMSYYLWFKDKRMFAILCYFLRMRKYLHYIYFLPHVKNYIPFEFIVDDDSIRAFHLNGTPLRIDLTSKKSNYLYEDHFKAYDIRRIE